MAKTYTEVSKAAWMNNIRAVNVTFIGPISSAAHCCLTREEQILQPRRGVRAAAISRTAIYTYKGEFEKI
ncbi:hypothetical protein AAHA92_12989 [Salvia divinorum]|uniref:Uncharacterized protein n=1 Tax=Salvia divinorum TaxID=28513 RepID=A0ABD1H816_SALDI